MRLILDSSVVIAAERRGDTVEQLIEKIVKATGDKEAALSAIGLTELIHGIYRAQTPQIRLRRESFIHELLTGLTVYPYTKETALLGGKIDGEQQESRSGDSVRRPPDRSHSAVARLPGANRQSAPSSGDVYSSFAYSALACFRMGMSGSASFQRVKKSWYAAFALAA